MITYPHGFLVIKALAAIAAIKLGYSESTPGHPIA